MSLHPHSVMSTQQQQHTVTLPPAKPTSLPHAVSHCAVLCVPAPPPQAFPMRDQHFYASIDKAQALLGWTPKYGLVDGLKDSYDKDFGRGMFRKVREGVNFAG